MHWLRSFTTAFLLLFPFSLLFPFPGNTQDTGNAGEDATVFTMVDEMPSFPGGKAKMKNYIDDHLELPEVVKEGKLSGKTYVSFVVRKDGELTDVRAMHGLCDFCNVAAEKVVRNMPDWEPGKLHGTPVNVRIVLPIRFHKGLE